jgi:hypothetical protein
MDTQKEELIYLRSNIYLKSRIESKLSLLICCTLYPSLLHFNP